MRPSRISHPALFVGLALVAGGPAVAHAQISDPGAGGLGSAEGAEFLLLPIGARTAAMGGAVTASRGSAESVLWNPAGLAAIERSRLVFNHSESAFDTRSDVVSFLWPTGSLGTVALTYYLVDFGELANTDVDGSVQGTISFRNQEFLISYARPLVGSLEAGFNYKLVQLVFDCQGQCPDQRSFTRSTHAVDISAIYHNPVGLPLSLGGSIRHLGFALEGESAEDPLPTRVRVGVAYQALSAFTSDTTFALVVAVDVEDRWHDPGNPEWLVGSEFGVAERFFLRAGYSFLDGGAGGPALGLGLIYDWFHVDLSRGFDDISSTSDDESVQVSFGVIF